MLFADLHAIIPPMSNPSSGTISHTCALAMAHIATTKKVSKVNMPQIELVLNLCFIFLLC